MFSRGRGHGSGTSRGVTPLSELISTLRTLSGFYPTLDPADGQKNKNDSLSPPLPRPPLHRMTLSNAGREFTKFPIFFSKKYEERNRGSATFTSPIYTTKNIFVLQKLMSAVSLMEQNLKSIWKGC